MPKSLSEPPRRIPQIPTVQIVPVTEKEKDEALRRGIIEDILSNPTIWNPSKKSNDSKLN